MSAGGGGGGGGGGGSSASVSQQQQEQQSVLDWKFSQVFGERAAGEEVQEVDIISAIEFDKSGEHLATGDRGGRVVLFERTESREQRARRELERADCLGPRHPEYRYSTEFQSHEPEFDYLKSLEIEEKINKIRWCQTANGARFLLSTNDKTIKLWKVSEKKLKNVSNLNLDPTLRLGNGSLTSSNPVLGQRGFTPRLSMNGGAVPQPPLIGNDFDFPPGGIPSLHLPLVVVFLLHFQRLLVSKLCGCAIRTAMSSLHFLYCDDGGMVC
jgi:serine/threonine-protein phosphatase 2A regulatory subunit B